MVTVFLPIESTRRELDYKINLARLFCSKGIEVMIGNPPFIRDELKYKNYQAIFLEKGLNPDPDYYSLLEDKGVYLYDLSDEGLSEPVYSINYQPTIDSLKRMRKIFLWGEGQKKDLISRNSDKLLSEKYKVVGSPAFDLCTQKYKKFHKKLKPSNFPKSYILINTNFGCFQSYDIDEQLKSCTLISPLTLEMWRKSYVKEEKEFNVFRVWLESIIESFPEEQFLIRPHPAEKQENYEKIFGKYKNLMVSKEGNANQAIASAKLILHKDCSTAMQGYLMGVPVISLGGELIYGEYAQWPLAFGALPKTLDDAKKLIQNVCLFGTLSEELQLEIDNRAKRILETNFHHIGNSSKELVDFILKDAEQSVINRNQNDLLDSRTIFEKLKVFIRKFLPLHYKIPNSTRETMIKFTKQDVLTRLSLFETVEPTKLKFSVDKIFPNTFKISRIYDDFR